MTNGSITLNTINDAELLLILEAKTKHQGVLFFNPQQMQPQPTQPQTYNNVSFAFSGDAGVRAALDLLTALSKKETAAASGQ